MSTIKVNTLDSTTGTTITVPTGKSFVVTDAGALTIGGTAITTGSTNILRKVADYTVVSGDVTAKSELVIACSAAASTRTITLPAVATSGLSTCIITIVADADATSTYKLMVEDSASAEVWTGYQKNDFVRLMVSNSAWVVLDHKETYYSRFYLTANQSIAASASVQLTGWTESDDIGNMWDNTNNEIVIPASGYIEVAHMTAKNATYTAGNPALKLDAAYIANWDQGGYGTDQYCHNTGMCGGIYLAAAAQKLEFWAVNNDSDTALSMDGGDQSATHFTVKFTRTY